MSRTRAPAVSHEVLGALYRYRLLTTSQLWELVFPATSVRWCQQTLADLMGQGLVARAPVGGSKLYCWYLTPAGVRATEGAETPRPFRMTAGKAVGPLQAHTLATVEVGLAFLRSARSLGHDLGGWAHEVPHPLGPGARAETLVVDAVVEYTVVTPSEQTYLVRFVEVDRGTERVLDLLAKLESYRRLFDYRPGWSAYPRWPRVCLVLDGLPQPVLERRIASLAEMASRTPRLAGRAELGATATTMASLVAQGPLARIWTPLLAPGPAVDLLGR